MIFNYPMTRDFIHPRPYDKLLVFSTMFIVYVKIIIVNIRPLTNLIISTWVTTEQINQKTLSFQANICIWQTINIIILSMNGNFPVFNYFALKKATKIKHKRWNLTGTKYAQSSVDQEII